VTDPNGNTNDYTITNGRVTTVTDGRGIPGNGTYSDHGEVKTTSAGGRAGSTYGYSPDTDGTYNLISATSSATGGNTTEFSYGTPAGNGATADYRPNSSKSAQNNHSTMVYNTWGQTTAVAVGRPTLTGTPLGGTITYTYHGSGGVTCGGKNGQVCSMVDGKSNTTTYTYNTAGNLITVNPPAPLGDNTFTYDAAGRVISSVDGRGNTTYTCYDKNDRVLQTSYTSSNCTLASGITMTYDSAGNLKTQVDTTGTTTWTYDAQMRAVSKDAPGTLNDSTATYDRAGNILTMIDGGAGAANTTTYRYDTANNLIALAEPNGSCAATLVIPNSTKCTVFTMSTTKDQRVKTQFPSGLTTTYGYDAFDRQTTITTKNAAGSTTLVNQTVAYLLVSADTALVQKLTDTVTPTNTTTYNYDDLDRLTTATRSGSNWAYTYDKNGNRTQQQATVGGITTTTNYGYNAADQMCWAGTGSSSTCTAPTGATTYSYDGNGNQNVTGGNTYSTFNQLTNSTAGAGQSYTYSGGSNNIRLTLGATSFTNNLLGQVTGETVGSITTKYVREPGGAPIAMQRGGASYYYTSDYNGSVILMTDNTQAAVASYKYDPYGKVTVTNNTSANVGDDNPWRYATGYQDPNTDYVKMGARYYNPAQGRFTQRDPSGQEPNAYQYAASNPASFNDPSGLFVSVPSDYIYLPDYSQFNDYCTYSPDQYLGTNSQIAADFRGPCAVHDQCTLNTELGVGNLFDCDTQFGDNLYENCNDTFAWYESDLYGCLLATNQYEAVVKQKHGIVG
jgi:RHS repeat-associated protein